MEKVIVSDPGDEQRGGHIERSIPLVPKDEDLIRIIEQHYGGPSVEEYFDNFDSQFDLLKGLRENEGDGTLSVC